MIFVFCWVSSRDAEHGPDGGEDNREKSRESEREERATTGALCARASGKNKHRGSDDQCARPFVLGED